MEVMERCGAGDVLVVELSGEMGVFYSSSSVADGTEKQQLDRISDGK